MYIHVPDFTLLGATQQRCFELVEWPGRIHKVEVDGPKL